MEKTSMDKIIFIGAIELSAHALNQLMKNDFHPELVITLHKELHYRHSDWFDLELITSSPILRVDDINHPDVIKKVKEINPDYIFVFGWSQLIKSEILNYKCLGLHPSLLPKGRGRAVIPWAILTQQDKTGVSIFHLDSGIDSGPLVSQREINLDPRETARSLYTKVIDATRDMVDELCLFLRNEWEIPALPQIGDPTYFAKRTPEDGNIDWNQDSFDIERLIRAVGNPYPGAFSYYKNKKVIIWEAEAVKKYNYTGVVGQILDYADYGHVVVQCGSGYLIIKRIEVDGEQKVPTAILKVGSKWTLSGSYLPPTNG